MKLLALAGVARGARLLLLATIVIFVWGLNIAQAEASAPLPTCDLVFSNDVLLKAVAVARTEQEKSLGLMNQKDVGNGMLFVWDKPDLRAFWMRNTPSALSIGFIAGDGTLFAIKDMQPETDDYHFSVQPAQYALELAQGDFERRGLTVGLRLLPLSQECGKAVTHGQE